MAALGVLGKYLFCIDPLAAAAAVAAAAAAAATGDR